MTDSDQRFDIYFAGECLEGADPAEVRRAVQALFKTDDATLDRLFSGARQRVRRGCDRETALRYQKAMQRAGARPIVVRAVASPGRASAATPLDLEPAGSDVLRPDERRRVETAQIETDHISAAAPGERLAPERPPVATISTPDFPLAAIGATIADPAAAPPPAAPDTSFLSLCDGEFDLSDCRRSSTVSHTPSTDHLSVSPPGDDLLSPEERHRETPPAPDTQHLSLETQEPIDLTDRSPGDDRDP